MFRGLLPALAACALAATACVRVRTETYTADEFVRGRWLPPLEPGIATREQVVSRLGPPSATFEGGRVVAYRLLLVEEDSPLTPAGYGAVTGSDWRSDLGSDDRRERLSRSANLVAGRDDPGDDRLAREATREAEYSLVVVFDGDLVRDHRLRRVAP